MEPIIVVGPAGSGKTKGFGVPTLTDWPGPAVVVGVHSGLLKETYQVRQTHGPIWIVDPEGTLGDEFPSAAFDLVEWAHSIPDAQDLASLLLSASGGPSTVWWQLAESWMASLFFAGARAGLRFDEIIDLVLEDRSPRGRIFVEETGEVIAARMFRSVCDLEHRARAEVLATARQSLRVFDRPGVLRSVIGDDFTLEDVLDRNGTLLLMMPRFRMRQLAPFFSLVLSRIWLEVEVRDAAAAPAGLPLLVLVDEAAPIPAVAQHLPEWSAMSARLGIQMITMWQDVAELRSRFGADTATVLGNTGPALFLEPGRDPDSLDYLVRLTASSSAGSSFSASASQAAADLVAQVPEHGHLLLGRHRRDLVRLPGWPAGQP